MIKILTIFNKKEAKFLRKPTLLVKKEEIPQILPLVEKMKKILITTGGLGLSANQIGLNKKFFIAQYKNKFYLLINPEIIKFSKKTEISEEGCLSIPGIVGFIKRAKKIVVKALDEKGKEIKIKAKDLLARIFQHEIDHLNGILIIDKAEKLYRIKNEDSTT